MSKKPMSKRVKIQPVKAWAAIINGKIDMVGFDRSDLLNWNSPKPIRVLIVPVNSKRKAGK